MDSNIPSAALQHVCPTCGQTVSQTVISTPVNTTATTKQTPKKTLRYTREATTFLLSGETYSVLDMIKKIPGKMWFSEKKQWRVPANETSQKMLEDIILHQLSS